jgi:hypothetical protein
MAVSRHPDSSFCCCNAVLHTVLEPPPPAGFSSICPPSPVAYSLSTTSLLNTSVLFKSNTSVLLKEEITNWSHRCSELSCASPPCLHRSPPPVQPPCCVCPWAYVQDSSQQHPLHQCCCASRASEAPHGYINGRTLGAKWPVSPPPPTHTLPPPTHPPTLWAAWWCINQLFNLTPSMLSRQHTTQWSHRDGALHHKNTLSAVATFCELLQA